MAKQPVQKKIDSAKTTAAIRLRMNRELVCNLLLTTLNSVESILDGAFLNETVTGKEAAELSSSLAQLRSVARKTFSTSDETGRSRMLT